MNDTALTWFEAGKVSYNKCFLFKRAHDVTIHVSYLNGVSLSFIRTNIKKMMKRSNSKMKEPDFKKMGISNPQDKYSKGIIEERRGRGA